MGRNTHISARRFWFWNMFLARALSGETAGALGCRLHPALRPPLLSGNPSPRKPKISYCVTVSSARTPSARCGTLRRSPAVMLPGWMLGY